MIAENKTYSEKLRDPRWQQLRLKILERDEWTCQKCYSGEKTLCVHHLYYVKGREPWEYNLDELVTTCEDCHQQETLDVNTATDQLVKEIKKKLLFSDNIMDVSTGFRNMEKPLLPIFPAALAEFLQNEERVDKMVSQFLNNGKPTN